MFHLCMVIYPLWVKFVASEVISLLWGVVQSVSYGVGVASVGVQWLGSGSVPRVPSGSRAKPLHGGAARTMER